MDDRRLVDELPLGLEALDDVLVAVLAETALVLRNHVGERTGVVERVGESRHARFLADAEVVFAVGRCDVDEADAVVGRDVVVVQDPERAFRALVGEIREDRLVFGPLQRRALELGDDLVLLRLLEDVRQPRLRHDVDRPLVVGEVPDGDIVDVGAGADREVLGERPWSGGPDEEVDGRRQLPKAVNRNRLRNRLHPHRHRRVLHVLVVRARLEVGERRRELPGIRHDAVRAVDATLLP